MWNSWVGLSEQLQMRVWEIVLNVQEEDDDGEESRIVSLDEVFGFFSSGVGENQTGTVQTGSWEGDFGPLLFLWFWKGGGDGIEFVEFVGVLYENIIHLPIFHHFHIWVQHNEGLLYIFWTLIVFNFPHRWSQRHEPRRHSRNHIRSISETIRGRSHGENGNPRAQEAQAILLVLRSEPCGAIHFVLWTQPGVDLTKNMRFSSRLYTVLIKDEIMLPIYLQFPQCLFILYLKLIPVCTMFFFVWVNKWHKYALRGGCCWPTGLIFEVENYVLQQRHAALLTNGSHIPKCGKLETCRDETTQTLAHGADWDSFFSN